MKKLHEKLKNMNEKNKKIFFLSVIVFSVLLILGVTGLTYAWFSANVLGNDTAKGVVVESGTLSIKYTNGSEIRGENIEPGWTETKTFTVENTGTLEATYKINWESITNTFVNKNDLVYTLTSTNGGGSLSETRLPNTNTHVNIINNIKIPAGIIQTYTLTITYKNTNEDQSSDMGKQLLGKIEVLDVRDQTDSIGEYANDLIIAKYSSNNTEGIIKVNQPATDQMKATTEYRYSGAGGGCKYEGASIIAATENAEIIPITPEDCTENMKVCTAMGMYIKIGGFATEAVCTDTENGLGGTVSTINPTWDDGDVKNYVKFNGETWRIIGAFEVEDGDGNYERRVKIIRDESIGYYSWDSSASDVNSGYGINQWGESEDASGNAYTGADLKILLNLAYYNKGTSTCYNGNENANTECDFSETGLNATARNMIDDAKWYTAGVNYNKTTPTTYTEERSNALPPTGAESWYNDTIKRTKNWTGKLALLYPSDYGYASSACYNANYTLGWSEEATSTYNSATCTSSNWLHTGDYYWTLSPDVSAPDDAFGVGGGGGVGDGDAYLAYGVRPVTYLKSSVRIKSGTGVYSSPYELSL